MKYINIKRFKFSTILKNFNTIIIKNFNTLIIKNLKIFGNNAVKLFKFVDLKRYDPKKIYKYLYIRRFSFTRIIKYFDPRKYNINRLKKIKFISSKFLLFHFPASIIFFGLLYLAIPTFYNYDKSNIENAICKSQKIKFSIKGKISYRFYPTPRIKIKDVTINDFFEKKDTLITAEQVVIKLSAINLLVKEKHKFEKIKLNDFEIKFDLKNLKKYKNIFTKKTNFVPITFKRGKIIFSDGNDYVATINGANINLKFIQDSIDILLKGKFLNDNLYINVNSKNVDNKISTDIILKMSDMNFLVKAKLFNFEKDKNTTTGNFLIKKDKNKITAVFDYKDNGLIINKSNLRNTFLDGKLEGKITLLPYFNFNLDLNLNSINFTKLYSYFLALDEKKIFEINKKINGKLNLSADKIYSKYNLTKSLESRIKFNNGDILIEQFLINLGKLGAVDVVGAINNDKKFTNFKFESNMFVDNKKKFLSKFGIYNKKNISSHLFVSGNFDLKNLRSSFYEISSDKKFSNEDVDYIEKEFNNLMFEDGYESLFNFPNFKEFIKSVTSTVN